MVTASALPAGRPDPTAGWLKVAVRTLPAVMGAPADTEPVTAVCPVCTARPAVCGVAVTVPETLAVGGVLDWADVD